MAPEVGQREKQLGPGKRSGGPSGAAVHLQQLHGPSGSCCLNPLMRLKSMCAVGCAVQNSINVSYNMSFRSLLFRTQEDGPSGAAGGGGGAKGSGGAGGAGGSDDVRALAESLKKKAKGGSLGAGGEGQGGKGAGKRGASAAAFLTPEAAAEAEAEGGRGGEKKKRQKSG